MGRDELPYLGLSVHTVGCAEPVAPARRPPEHRNVGGCLSRCHPADRNSSRRLQTPCRPCEGRARRSHAGVSRSRETERPGRLAGARPGRSRDSARSHRGLCRNGGRSARTVSRSERGTMTRLVPRLIALSFACAALCSTRIVAQGDGIAITSPEAGAYMSGRVTHQARVPLATEVESVTFFVDDREVCIVTRRPYDCDWNAGRIIRERQVRMAVRLKNGERVVKSVRTGGLDYAANTTVQAVQVTVSVLQDGRFVTGLPQSAFTIQEDGRPQTVNGFIAEDGPLELVVAVDISGSMKEALPTVKRAVQAFLSAVPPNNYVTVLAFNEEVFEVSPRAIGAAERSKKIDELEAWGATVHHDALMRGLDALDEQAGRKALVVFTDGEDRGSNSALGEVERRLEGSDATLYMIGQGRGTSAESLKRLMERLSEPTGGRALFTDRLDELSQAFGSLLEELRHQYLLGYQSTNSAKDGTWRAIKVDAAGPGRVRARRGYRAVLEP